MAAMIKEVAKRAGVSTATVSRILNGKGGHSSSTVKTVERIIEELGFAPGQLGSAPDCIGIVMLTYRDFISNDYSAALLSAIMETLAAEGMLAQIIPVTPGRLSFQYIREIVEAYSLKGLIIQEFDQLYAVTGQLSRLTIPLVCVGSTDNTLMPHALRFDNYAAGRDAAAYFWSLGHRRFGAVSMRLSNVCQQARVDGFRDFILEHGGVPEDFWTREYYGIEDSVTAAAAELANGENHPTAIFSTNSVMARKLMIELRRMRFHIPDDISLISFEDRGELAELELPMTAISQPTRLMGESAVRILISLLRGCHAPEIAPLRCNLIVRQTTAHVHHDNQ